MKKNLGMWKFGDVEIWKCGDVEMSVRETTVIVKTLIRK